MSTVLDVCFCFPNLLLFLKLQSFTKIAGHFAAQENAQIATYRKVWRSVV